MNKKQSARLNRLLPNGIPKYVRIYDNKGRSIDNFTVVYTGRYRKRTPSGQWDCWFQVIGMNSAPFHPQGFCQHSEYESQIDVDKHGFAPAIGRKNHLGTRITFQSLPKDCQTAILSDYKSIWNLTFPLTLP